MPSSGRELQKTSTSLKQRIPALLIAARILLGPLLFGLVLTNQGPALILAALIAAMLSDIFDGVIARRMKIATERLRVADSYTDAWFFVWVGAAIWRAVPQLVEDYRLPLLTELALQLASYAYDLVRYRRISSLHAYSAKLWAITLFIAAGSLLAFHYGPPIWLTFAFGLVSFFDALAIKLILPGWHHDVLSAVHAWRQKNPA